MSGCHPGYGLNVSSNMCVCQATNISDALRCDNNNRYIFLRVRWRKGDNCFDKKNCVVCGVCVCVCVCAYMCVCV